MTEDIKPELIEKATSAVRHERAYIAAAAFGVPLDAVSECAGMIAHAVLSAVADDLRAEAWYAGFDAAIDATPDDYWCRAWDGVPNPYRKDNRHG